MEQLCATQRHLLNDRIPNPRRRRERVAGIVLVSAEVADRVVIGNEQEPPVRDQEVVIVCSNQRRDDIQVSNELELLIEQLRVRSVPDLPVIDRRTVGKGPEDAFTMNDPPRQTIVVDERAVFANNRTTWRNEQETLRRAVEFLEDLDAREVVRAAVDDVHRGVATVVELDGDVVESGLPTA